MNDWRGLQRPESHIQYNSYSLRCEYCACPCARDLMCRCCGQAEVERLRGHYNTAMERIHDLLNEKAESERCIKNALSALEQYAVVPYAEMSQTDALIS